jgi:hypothetical protein
MPGMKSVVGMNGMGDARELAEMLRQMGRGRDTVLAHITPEEAQMLMDMGGSGTTNPDTGLPEFLDIYGGDDAAAYVYDAERQPEGFYGNTDFATFNPATQETRLYSEPISSAQPGPDGSFKDFYDRALRGTVTPGIYDVEEQAGGFYGGRAPSAQEYAAVYPELQPGMIARGAQAVEDTARQARELAGKYPTVARLLSTGASSLPALLQAARARRESEQAQSQLRRLGEPLRTQGEALRQQALAGGLTPQQAQQQQAERARLRQAASGRGATTGTQAAMIENQLARQRSGLSETNLNNAIKLLNLANAYEEEAIRAKLAGDARINRYIGNIFANLGQTSASTAGQQEQPQESRPAVTRRPDTRQG